MRRIGVEAPSATKDGDRPAASTKGMATRKVEFIIINGSE
jgi:hypothetical protein